VRIGLPALAVLGVELPGLADVVTERTRYQEITLNLERGHHGAHLVRELHGQPGHAADVIGLTALLQRIDARITGRLDVGNGIEAALRQRQRPGLDDTGAQLGIGDLLDFRQLRAHPRP